MAFSFRSPLIAFTLLILAVQSAVPAVANEKLRPFQGTAKGTITSISESGVITLEYTGNATHLGRFTRTETLQFTGANESGATFTAYIVFTAANGDKLHTNVEGVFDGVTATGTYYFDGGTGRFANATGIAGFTAHASGPQVTVEFSGKIRY